MCRSIFAHGRSCFICYILGNHPQLTYQGGQEPILHLEADLHQTIAWANSNSHRWAFSLTNAGAHYAQFRATVEALNQINWEAVAARDFRPSHIKEGKQAEFLSHNYFPWHLITRIGVQSQGMQSQAQATLQTAIAAHKPPVEVKPQWYY